MLSSHTRHAPLELSIAGSETTVPSTIAWQLGIHPAPIWYLVLGLLFDAIRGMENAASAARRRWMRRQAQVGRSLGGHVKRQLDILVASLALLLFLPVMIAIAVLIKLTMGGSVVYAHPRIGQRGKVFRCLKFRSMVENGEEVLQRHLASNPDAAREWQETRKLRNDPRVTSLGRFLRKSSLDELPQLINVLKGEMSCVGPRPIVSAELERYGDQVAYYLAARPGVTGVWQVSGRSSTGYAERVMLDSYYFHHWSVWLDLRIMALTVPAVLRFSDSA